MAAMVVAGLRLEWSSTPVSTVGEGRRWLQLVAPTILFGASLYVAAWSVLAWGDLPPWSPFAALTSAGFGARAVLKLLVSRTARLVFGAGAAAMTGSLGVLAMFFTLRTVVPPPAQIPFDSTAWRAVGAVELIDGQYSVRTMMLLDMARRAFLWERLACIVELGEPEWTEHSNGKHVLMYDLQRAPSGNPDAHRLFLKFDEEDGLLEVSTTKWRATAPTQVVEPHGGKFF